MDVAKPIDRAWEGEPCIVVGTGPSLTPEVVREVRLARWLKGWRILLVNDAYRRFPVADALYAADASWWREHKGVPTFEGEKWTVHSIWNDRSELAEQFNLRLVWGLDETGFSKSQRAIHCGGVAAHSGFQAVNLAVLLGASPIVLCGFDYRGSHFFGEHQNLRQALPEHYAHMAQMFDCVETDAEIINATPDSKLTRFPYLELNEALRRHDRVPRHRPEPHASAG